MSADLNGPTGEVTSVFEAPTGDETAVSAAADPEMDPNERYGAFYAQGANDDLVVYMERRDAELIGSATLFLSASGDGLLQGAGNEHVSTQAPAQVFSPAEQAARPAFLEHPSYESETLDDLPPWFDEDSMYLQCLQDRNEAAVGRRNNHNQALDIPPWDETLSYRQNLQEQYDAATRALERLGAAADQGFRDRRLQMRLALEMAIVEEEEEEEQEERDAFNLYFAERFFFDGMNFEERF